MKEKTVKGILLEYIKSSKYDAKITILANDGNFYKLYCKGIRKDESKNRSNLFFSSIIDFTFFENNQEVSMMKKCKLRTKISNDEFKTINQMILICPFTDNKTFLFLKKSIKLYEKNHNLIVFLINYLFFLKINIDIKKCWYCAKTEDLQFATKKNLVICKKCAIEKKIPVLSVELNKTMFQLFKKKYSILNNINDKQSDVIIKILKRYIYEICDKKK